MLCTLISRNFKSPIFFSRFLKLSKFKFKGVRKGEYQSNKAKSFAQRNENFSVENIKKKFKIMNYKLKIPLSIKEFVYRLIRGVLYTFTFILCVSYMHLLFLKHHFKFVYTSIFYMYDKQILGLSLVLFSFWYIYEGKNYHLDASMKFCVFTVAFVVGFVLLALSLCGLASVFNESLFLAKIVY